MNADGSPMSEGGPQNEGTWEVVSDEDEGARSFATSSDTHSSTAHSNPSGNPVDPANVHMALAEQMLRQDPRSNAQVRSRSTNKPVRVRFHNATTARVCLNWHNYAGIGESHYEIDPGCFRTVSTYEGHPWTSCTRTDNRQLLMNGDTVHFPEADVTTVEITDPMPENVPSPSNSEPGPSAVTPCGGEPRPFNQRPEFAVAVAVMLLCAHQIVTSTLKYYF